MEIVIRALVLFLFLWGITRLVGRSSVGELSTFQLVLFVAMGDLVQQGITQDDVSMTSAVLTIGVFAVLTLALSMINARFPRMRGITHGVPVVIVHDGEPDLQNLKRERLSLDDLMAAARQQGIRRFADIDLAVLETNGRISFFARTSAQVLRPVSASRSRSTMPTPGPTVLWNSSECGADGCGRVGASFLAACTLVPTSTRVSCPRCVLNAGNWSDSSSFAWWRRRSCNFFTNVVNSALDASAPSSCFITCTIS